MVETAQSLHPVDRERLPVGGVFSMTFRILGKAPLVFVLFGLLSQSMTLGRLLFDPPVTADFDVAEAVVLAGTLLLSFLLQSAATYVAVRLYNRQLAPIGEALVLGARRYLPMAGTTLLYLLAVYVGIILLIVPGVIVGLIFAVAIQVCALESAGPITSLKRSKFLTKDERWPIFGVYCIFVVPLATALGVVAVVSTMWGHFVAGKLIDAAIQVVWFPLASILSTVVYAELRRLKETVGVARIFD